MGNNFFPPANLHLAMLALPFIIICMPITTLFFDLDDTLYPPSSGVWDAIGNRIDEFIITRVGVPREEVSALREHLYHTYGTTLRGLTVTRGIDAADYLAFVHDIPLQAYLTPDERVRNLLQRYPQRKVIFTNADQAHARRVLAVLNLSDCFDQIIDVLDVAPDCKPMPGAFQRALALAGAASAREAVLIDDAPHNLKAAREAGFYAIRIGPPAQDGCCDAVIPSLLELPGVLDPLLDSAGKSG